MQLKVAATLALAMVAVTVAAQEPPDAATLRKGEPPSGLIESPQSRPRPVTLERTQQWTLRAANGRQFEVSVALPEGTAPQQGYPVLYVLDANYSFGTLVEMVRNHETLFGPVVVVGVGYSSDAEMRNRFYDMTPPGTDASELPKLFSEGWGPMGGAAEFRDFLTHDLRSAVKAIVPVDASRQALFGHSLGGLFALYVLFTRPESFDTYVAGSPAIWWSNKVVLQELAAFVPRLRQAKGRRRLLITVGGLEGRNNPEELRYIERLKLPGGKEMPEMADMIGNSRRLHEELAPLLPDALSVDYVVFPGETHNSVIPAYLGRGARFALSGWYP